MPRKVCCSTFDLHVAHTWLCTQTWLCTHKRLCTHTDVVVCGLTYIRCGLASAGPNIDQGLSGGLGPLLARAANGLLAGFRNAKEQGVFSQFGEELRNIFAIDEPDSELEDNDFDEQAYQQQLLQAVSSSRELPLFRLFSPFFLA